MYKMRDNRTLDNPLMVLNLDSFKEQIKHEQSFIEKNKNSITIFKSDGMRIVMIALGKGAELKTHTAAGVISVQVLEGEMQFISGQQSVELNAGKILALHQGIAHSVIASLDTIFLLTLSIPGVKK